MFSESNTKYVHLKKILTAVIALVLCVLILPLKADAAEITAIGTCGENLTWILDDEGRLNILGTGDMYDYTYDKETASYTAPWYLYMPYIKDVFIGDGVTSIGNSAFEECVAIQNVTIADSVLSIGERAFRFCRNLTEITIPQNVTFLGYGAFSWCAKLERVDLPNGLTTIEHFTFSNCGNLTEINMPTNLTIIYPAAFSYCSSLQKITIPVGVSTIQADTFEGCTNLREITFHQKYMGFTDDAFEGCNQIRDIYYGGTKADWEVWCTGNRPSATYIHYSCTVPEGHWVEESTPATCITEGCTRTVCSCGYICNETSLPKEHSYEGGICSVCGAPEGMQYSVVNNYGANLIRIDSYTGTAEKLIIPTSIAGYPVIAIDAAAFKFCSSLKELEIPATVSAIGAYAFYGCDGLTKVSIPSSIQTIEERTFYNCTNLEEIIIPSTVIFIDDFAFGNCDNVKEVYYGGTQFNWCLLNRTPKAQYIHYSCVTPENHWVEETIPATCELGSSICTSCSCGYAQYKTISDPLGHTKVIDAAVAATCTKTGLTEGMHCSVCNTVIVAQETIPMKAHTEVVDKAVAATCTAAGKTEGKHCSVCNTVIVAQQTVPAKGHTEVVDKAVAATCTAAGKTEGKHCSVCGVVTVAQQNVPATGHTYDNGVDGTCNGCGIHRETTEDRTVMHMFRMYDPNSGEHFYTGSVEERENLVAAGWNYEGVGFTFSRTTGLPVYRLYDPATGEHLYTMSEEEKAMLEAQGWNFEGIAFNSAYDTEVPQYRLHNPNATRGAYHFTASLEERDYLISIGWEDQGIGFYSSWK